MELEQRPCTSQQATNSTNNNIRQNGGNSRTRFEPNDTSAPGIKDERVRRRTAYEFRAKIREEQRKTEQGIFSEQKIDEFFRDLDVNDDLEEGEESMRTVKAETEVLDQLIQLSTTQLDSLRNETARTLDPDLFLTRIKTFARHEHLDEEGNVFINLGRRYAGLFRCVPDLHFLRPCIELKKGPQLRERAERKAVKRKLVQDKQEVKAKTLRELQEENTENGSVSKELDSVKKQLRQLYKKEQSNAVDYYKFVLNPNNFGETVENMFYVSFLVKDGYIRLRIDPQNGYPQIVKIPREEHASCQVQRSELETKQVVCRLDYSAWQRLVLRLGIKEPYLKRTTRD